MNYFSHQREPAQASPRFVNRCYCIRNEFTTRLELVSNVSQLFFGLSLACLVFRPSSNDFRI